MKRHPIEERHFGSEFRVYAVVGRVKAELRTLRSSVAARLLPCSQEIAFLLALVVFTQTAIGSGLANRLDGPVSSSSSATQPDWSVAVVESTMKRYPTADSLKGWGYAKSLYLYGVYLVYLRTKDPRYLNHIKSWIELHIDDKGTINRPINALDYMLPGNLLLILYKETGQEKYKLAADNIRKTFDTYPRTKDA